jgi:D-aminopeptidase
MDELGQIDGPIMLTNTHSVGVVHDAVIAWRVRAGPADPSGYWWSSPVVAETWDGDLNDINGFHVRPVHVDRALDEAKGGPVAEGNVGGGTGMICFDFKCGIGTASRRIDHSNRQYIVGVLVQANYGNGARELLRIAGVPVGQLIGPDSARKATGSDTGSIIVVVATDAPLLPHQMKRIARRAALGLGRTGSYAANGSGDIFVAFSTANPAALQGKPLADSASIGNGYLDPLFASTVEATEEAIVNALVAARDMRGTDGHVVRALPHEALLELLKRQGRYQAPH